MQASLKLKSNTISPSLRRRASRLKDKTPILKAMGEYGVQMTKRAFNEPSLRPHAWPGLASGGRATLRKNNVLARSPRVVRVGREKVVIGSDRHYAVIHQLGGQTRPHVIRPKHGKALNWPGARHPVAKVNHPGSKIPARPYFPFYANGKPTPRFKRGLNAVVKTKLDKLLER